MRSVAGPGELEPLVAGVDFDALAAKARARTGRAIPDMGAWQRLTLPAGTDADAAIEDLLASGQVTDAYVAPDAAPPPQQTPADARLHRRCRATCARRRRASTPTSPARTRAPAARA